MAPKFFNNNFSYDPVIPDMEKLTCQEDDGCADENLKDKCKSAVKMGEYFEIVYNTAHKKCQKQIRENIPQLFKDTVTAVL